MFAVKILILSLSFIIFLSQPAAANEKRNLDISAVRAKVTAEVQSIFPQLNKEAEVKGLLLKLVTVIDAYILDSKPGTNLFKATIKALDVHSNRYNLKLELQYSQNVYPKAPFVLVSWNQLN